jgi:urease accessory protein
VGGWTLPLSVGYLDRQASRDEAVAAEMRTIAMQMRSLPLALLALCLIGSPAFAHIGLGQSETFSSGFLHPLGGIDHVLAMVAVGLYAASLGGSAIWLLPAAFIGTMVVGGVLGYAGLSLPYVEQGIGLSVVLMGIAIALGMRLPTAVAMGVVSLFALFHGHAHGSEGAQLAAFLPYAAGFVIATFLLHMAGISVGLGFDRLGRARSEFLRRAAGSISAVAGISLLAGWLAA